MTDKLFVGTTEAGRLLGRNPSTVIKMIKAGELKGSMIGTKWAIPYADVLELSKTIKPSSEASAENIRKAHKTIRPKPISNKAPRHRAAGTMMDEAIANRQPAQDELLAQIRAMGKVGE